MKFTAIVYTLMAAATTYAAAAPAPDGGLQARDTCGPNFGADQRRTNSPCQASNGDRHFCGCDRTGVVECRKGKWVEIRDCGRPSCRGGSQGGANC